MERAGGEIFGCLFILAIGLFIGMAWLAVQCLILIGQGLRWLYEEVWLAEIWPVIVEKWQDWQYIQEQSQKPQRIDTATTNAMLGVDTILNVDTIMSDFERRVEANGSEQREPIHH